MKKFDYRKLTEKFKQFMIESENEYTLFLYDGKTKYKFGNVSFVSSFVGAYGFAIAVSVYKVTDTRAEMKDFDKIQLFFNIVHNDDVISGIKLTIISDNVEDADQLKTDIDNGSPDKSIYTLGSWISSQIFPLIKRKLKGTNQSFGSGIRTDFVHLNVDTNEKHKLFLNLGEHISRSWLSKHTFKSATVQGK